MRKTIIYFLFLLFPVFGYAVEADFGLLKITKDDVYQEMNLAENGLSRGVFELAVKGLNKLDTTGKLQNASIVTIADYSQSSNRKRLYVIDLKNKKLLFNTFVAHGRNTGEEYAKRFSNDNGSSKSSMGFYVTEKPIMGGHTGFALQIDGVEKGYNDHALQRSIIIHAANYATADFIKRYGRLGRSLGCPALPPDLNRPIIDTIKNGTCLFIYSPDNKYLCSSTLLN